MPLLRQGAANAALAAALATCGLAQAQGPAVTEGQRAAAQQVAQAGVPLSELAPDAPDRYTIRPGDTLWAIAGVFLKTPWRWPELWGMNLQDIRNPHRIYPGQVLVLDRSNGQARLRSAQADANAPLETVKVSPRTRYESLAANAIPTLATHLIEPFLAEPLVVDADTLERAPRIVATNENRVLLSRGDRAYARGPAGSPLLDDPGEPHDFRVFRNVTPLKDPDTGRILGYEAQYVGKAHLARGEYPADERGKGGDLVAATIDIVQSKEEMRAGDRLLPEPPRQMSSYVPHAPSEPLGGRIVSVYGSAVVNAAQNQVVAINKGTRDGVETGHVMVLLKDGGRVLDRTDPERSQVRLPDERNGLIMVFRPFETVSYALILQITDGVRVGDRFMTPQ
jgi:hypothetical protein